MQSGPSNNPRHLPATAAPAADGDVPFIDGPIPFPAPEGGPTPLADAEVLHHLWERHRRWAAAILLAYKPRWADLDDLLQEVALTVVRKGAEIRDIRAFRPWLRTVAINVAHLAARKGGRAADRADAGETEPATPAGQAPSESAARSAEGRRIMELAMTLPDGYREPLLLKAVQGLSYRQIGQIMNLPETTVETRIARARRMLREEAEKQDRAQAAATGNTSARI